MHDYVVGIVLGAFIAYVVLKVDSADAEAAAAGREGAGEGAGKGAGKGDFTVYDALFANNMHALYFPDKYAFRLVSYDRRGRRVGTTVPTLDTVIGRGQKFYMIPLGSEV